MQIMKNTDWAVAYHMYVVLKKGKKENCHKICIWHKRYNNMIFVFNSEIPTNIAVQNETE
jgi:hypothetical protein